MRELSIGKSSSRLSLQLREEIREAETKSDIWGKDNASS